MASWRKLNTTSPSHVQAKESGLPSLAPQSLHRRTNPNLMGQFLCFSLLPILRCLSQRSQKTTLPIILLQNNCLWSGLSFIIMRFLWYWFNQISPKINECSLHSNMEGLLTWSQWEKIFWVIFPVANIDHNLLSVKWGYYLPILKRPLGGWHGKQCILTEPVLNTGTKPGMRGLGFWTWVCTKSSVCYTARYLAFRTLEICGMEDNKNIFRKLLKK